MTSIVYHIKTPPTPPTQTRPHPPTHHHQDKKKRFFFFFWGGWGGVLAFYKINESDMIVHPYGVTNSSRIHFSFFRKMKNTNQNGIHESWRKNTRHPENQKVHITNSMLYKNLTLIKVHLRGTYIIHTMGVNGYSKYLDLLSICIPLVNTDSNNSIQIEFR